MDFVGKRHLFFSASALLALVSLASVLLFGIRPGIDLKGGAEWRVAAREASRETGASYEASLRATHPGVAFSVSPKSQAKEYLVRTPPVSESDRRVYSETITRLGLGELSFVSIGPAVGAELRAQAIRAVILVLLGISLYAVWAFRKISGAVPSWKYGLVTLLTLFHDVVIPTGFLVLLGRISGLELDTNFIVALLVIVGFSVHDTIVVFDRMRENLELYGRKKTMKEIVNLGLSETVGRSVNTSLTLILVLTALLIFGPQTLFYFSLTIMIGVVFGTYSSIFIASPLIYEWSKDGKHGRRGH